MPPDKQWHDIYRRKLRDLISERGVTVCNDTPTLKNLLADVFQNQPSRREAHWRIETLVLIAENGAIEELRSTSAVVPYSITAEKLAQSLYDQKRIEKSALRWAIDTWAIAIGVISESDIDLGREHQGPVNPPTPRVASGTPNEPVAPVVLDTPKRSRTYCPKPDAPSLRQIHEAEAKWIELAARYFYAQLRMIQLKYPESNPLEGDDAKIVATFGWAVWQNTATFADQSIGAYVVSDCAKALVQELPGLLVAGLSGDKVFKETVLYLGRDVHVQVATILLQHIRDKSEFVGEWTNWAEICLAAPHLLEDFARLQLDLNTPLGWLFKESFLEAVGVRAEWHSKGWKSALDVAKRAVAIGAKPSLAPTLTSVTARWWKHEDLRWLLDLGANANEGGQGLVPAAAACHNPDIRVLELLLSSGANPNLMLRTDGKHLPPNEPAYSYKGKPIRVPSFYVESPLLFYVAQHDGSGERIKLLLRFGANPNAKDSKGMHVLDHPISEAVRATLISAGARS